MSNLSIYPSLLTSRCVTSGYMHGAMICCELSPTTPLGWLQSSHGRHRQCLSDGQLATATYDRGDIAAMRSRDQGNRY
jgi:hypothetical protein